MTKSSYAERDPVQQHQLVDDRRARLVEWQILALSHRDTSLLDIDPVRPVVLEDVEAVAGPDTIEPEAEQRLSVRDLRDDVNAFERERISEIGCGVRIPATTSSPWAFTKYSA